MVIIHRRDIHQPEWTLGTLSIVYAGRTDEAQFGYIAEDTDRGLKASMPLAEIERVKVKGRTAIPYGEYKVAFTWSNKYQKEMPLLHDVPGFRGIRIHVGNDAGDTEGCVCPALQRDTEKGTTSKSKPATEWLHNEIRKCEARGEPVVWRVTL
jgi:hypothetical protein